MVHMPFLDGFAGVSKDGFFGGLPDWVDKKKAPGHTSQARTLGWQKTLRNIATLSFFFWSPNLIWFCITFLVHMICPYDIAGAAAGWSWGLCLRRLVVNFTVAFSYYGFFYWALYIKGAASRKFQPGVVPTFGNMLHNMWYWSLGILQWTVYECGMMWLWGTGAVSFVSNMEVLSSPKMIAIHVCWILVIPVWRDLHFYVAHRFIHIRAVYKYVHSLHHRNTDPEPFSGMTMHPVEHLYYFSNSLVPSLFLNLSPLIFMWNFMHLTLAPGAGHSGWEDHWQADQYHFVHHNKFECNYGSPSSAWIDQYFGTFREKLGSSEIYTGEFKEKDDAPAKSSKKVWSVQSYLGIQARDHAIYTFLCLVCVLALAWGAIINPQSAVPITTVAGIPIAKAVAALVSHGPVVFAMALWAVYDRMSWRWPFQKERVLGGFGFFLAAGWLACLFPVFRFVDLLCAV